MLRNGLGSKFTFFQKKKIDLEKKLKTLNDLLLKCEGNNYEDFCVCLVHFLLSDISFGLISRKKKSEVRMSFNFLFNFWTTADENGSMKWNVAHDKISILYYSSDENVAGTNAFSVKQLFSKLMDFILGAGNFRLLCRCLILNTAIMIVLGELSLFLEDGFFYF